MESKLPKIIKIAFFGQFSVLIVSPCSHKSTRMETVEKLRGKNDLRTHFLDIYASSALKRTRCSAVSAAKNVSASHEAETLLTAFYHV
jgi:hypothetical protein